MLDIKIEIIKKIFNIIGAAADAANLLFEFSIADKKDESETNNKKGNVILLNVFATSNLLGSSTKPGEIINITPPMKISHKNTSPKSIINKKLNIEFANKYDCFLFLNFVYIGIKAELKEPSAKRRLKVFGSLNATKKASAREDVPINIAIKMSLK